MFHDKIYYEVRPNIGLLSHLMFIQFKTQTRLKRFLFEVETQYKKKS